MTIGRPRKVAWVPEDRGFETPCHIHQLALNKGGYGLIFRDGKSRIAHKWYWEREHGPVPGGFELHHRCEVRECVNDEHLTLITRLEHNRLQGTVKLSAEARAAILASDETGVLLAARYGVTPGAVSLLRLGKTWA